MWFFSDEVDITEAESLRFGLQFASTAGLFC